MRRAHPLLALLFVTLPLAAAKRSGAEQEKIDWLLSEIERSDAAFLRNGAEYGGPEAASHLKTKLFWAGKRVQTARDFILGVCSHSKASGKPYEIRFRDGTRRPLEKWLFERLDAFETIRPRLPRPATSKTRLAPSIVSAVPVNYQTQQRPDADWELRGRGPSQPW